MSDYQIVVARSAQKQLDSLPIKIRNRIESKIEALAIEQRPPNCRKLKGEKNSWRIRVGDYRVTYSIDDKSCTVDIQKVGHRQDIYEN